MSHSPRQETQSLSLHTWPEPLHTSCWVCIILSLKRRRMRQAEETDWQRDLGSSLLLGNVEEEHWTCSLEQNTLHMSIISVTLYQQPPLLSEQTHMLLWQVDRTERWAEMVKRESETQGKVKVKARLNHYSSTGNWTKTEVWAFDSVDHSITVGNDVTFMSQDDCVQPITLQWNQQWYNSTGCYSAWSSSYI